jgi:hypothetical protein
MTTVIARLSSLIAQYRNLQAHTAAEYTREQAAHRAGLKQASHDAIQEIQDEWLPSGGGIDAWCQVDLDKSHADRIVLTVSFHHMSEHGCYDGWSNYRVTLRPSFEGSPRITITGRDRNGVKDHIADTLHHMVMRSYMTTAERVRICQDELIAARLREI